MEEEREAAIVCKRRLSHLQEYDGLSEEEQQLWKKKRLDRMLVEYCLRLGYYDTALNLSTHSNIKVSLRTGLYIGPAQAIYRPCAGFVQALCRLLFNYICIIPV